MLNRAGLWRRLTLALVAGALIALSLAPAANAADRIYWANLFGNTISYANLDGSGGADLPIDASTLDGPMGLGIDTQAGKIYWANYGADVGGHEGRGTSIGIANLDGSGAHLLPITPGLVLGPHGIAVDAGGNKLYWTSHDQDNPNAPANSWIGVSKLDGSGATKLNVGQATLNGPRGLALDLAAKKIYWGNYNGDSIAYASTDGGSGANINTNGATVDGPEGIALDGTGRLFYSNFTDVDRISYLRLDGSGGADFDASPLTPTEPHGVALDPYTGRLYWPNFNPSAIAYANLSGGGGTILSTAGTSISGPDLPILFKAPAPNGPATIKGETAPGSKLKCANSFRADLLNAQLYQAPQSLTFQWRKSGATIPGKTSRTLKVHKLGDYSCDLVGQNLIGSASETSKTAAVFKLGKPSLNPDNGTATLAAKLPAPGKLTVKGKTVVKQRPAAAGGDVRALSRKVKGRHAKLLIKPKGKAKRKLLRTGKAKVKTTITFHQKKTGATGIQKVKIKLKLR